MKKRFLPILFALALCLTLLPTVALADGGGVTTADDLIAAVTSDGTVTLGADIALSNTLTITGTVTLDLNGHTLTGAVGNKGADWGDPGTPGGTAITVTSGGDLTITGSGSITGGNGGDGNHGSNGGSGGTAITVKDGGSLTVSGGEIKGGNGGSGGNGGDGGSAIAMEGGSLTITGTGSISGGNGGNGNWNAADDKGSFGGSGGNGLLIKGGTATINSGTINGGNGGTGGEGHTIGGAGGAGGAGLSVTGGTVTINNGTINGGNGGNGGKGGDAADEEARSGGAGGNGGEGLSVTAGTVTVGGSGTISGGNAGSGGAAGSYGSDGSNGDPGKAILTSGKGSIGVSSADALTKALSLGATSIKLTDDITIDSTLTISNTVTLDLNGHVLKMAEGSSGSVIKVESSGNLTLNDSNSTALHRFTPDETGRWVLDETNGTRSVSGGVITGGTEVSNGGGVHNQGTFTMNGGVIVGNSSYNGGGVKNERTFTMTGGQIVGNTAVDGGGIHSSGTKNGSDTILAELTVQGSADIYHNHAKNGGGIYAEYTTANLNSSGTVSHNTATSCGGGICVLAGSFTMRGGAISGNSVSCADGSGLGGGLYYSNDCTVIMVGGKITGNNADGKGGGVYCGGASFTVSEDASVTDNVVGGTEGTDYQYYGGKDSNVYLPGSRTITISGSFYGTLGVTTEQTVAAYPSAVTIAAGAESTQAYNFTSDNGLYSVEKTYDNDKKAYVIQFVGKCAHENLTEADGTYTCNDCGKSMVAKLTRGEGDSETTTWYSTFADALLAAQTDGKAGTVTLLTSLTDGGRINNSVSVRSGSFTLDLNGHTVEFMSGTHLVITGGSVTITDSADGGSSSGKISSVQAKENGTLTVSGGTVDTLSGNGTVIVGTPAALTAAVSSGVSNIRLANDITLSETLNVTQDLILDLNGHVLSLKSDATGSVIRVGNSAGTTASITTGKLTLKDSNSTALHRFTPDETGRWVLDETNGTKTVTGGIITGGNNEILGGGVYVYPGSSFTMTGGTVVGNTAHSGGGVYVDKNPVTGSAGTFTMNGGAIIGNTAKQGGGVFNSGSFTMTSGSIDGNRAISDSNGSDGSGGGVRNSGTFVMTGGSISGNRANGSGGGVSSGGSDTSFTMSGDSEISDNEAALYGGGVYVGNGSFTMNGGSISGNKAVGTGTEFNEGNGGGVYVGYSGTFEMNGGTISGNSATTAASNTDSGNGGGVYVEESRSANGTSTGNFTLNGGSITDNSATNTANDVTGCGSGNVSHPNGNSFAPSTGSKTVTFMTDDNTVFGVEVLSSAEDKATEPAQAPTRDGYTFDGWYTDSTCNTAFDFTSAITADITLYAKWTAIPAGTPSGGSFTPAYSVTAPTAANGAVTVSPKNAVAGTTVTVTAAPDAGYALEALTVTDRNGRAVELTDLGNGKYSFKMPAGSVTVNATFMEDNTMLNFFTDVTADKYYYDAVLWAARNGITGGVDETHFGPDRSCTRAQLVTFLWRAAGCPVVNYAMDFSDVGDDYYTEAVRWAASLDIVGGYGNGLFGTNDTITREQVVTILYRYVQAQGGGFTGTWMFRMDYTDLADMSDWAYEAVAWCSMNNIMQGYDGKIMPKDTCTRAQIVTMLYRLLGE